MGLNYDIRDKSENLRRINHFEKFNKANRNFFQNMLDFLSFMCVFWQRLENMIWDALDMRCTLFQDQT